MVSVGNASFFSDPTGLFTTSIPDHWVYQAHQSNSLLTVFYGEGDFELLYFEQFGLVSDGSPKELADRTLKLYSEPGGLLEFQFMGPLEQIEVTDQSGVAALYTYKDERGNVLWEQRLFLILPGGRGFSITQGGDGVPLPLNNPILAEILKHWRWLE